MGIGEQLVYPVDWESKDLALFHNRGVLHSVVGAFEEDQIRMFHQVSWRTSGSHKEICES